MLISVGGGLLGCYDFCLCLVGTGRGVGYFCVVRM